MISATRKSSLDAIRTIDKISKHHAGIIRVWCLLILMNSFQICSWNNRKKAERPGGYTVRSGIIPDEQIPAADPAEVVKHYSAWVWKIVNRYKGILERSGAIGEDDLFQVGCMALLDAQKKYDPAAGACFLSFSFNFIRKAMRRELGFFSDGRLPEMMDSLDRLLSGDSDTCLIDFIPDPSPTAEETHIEQDAKDETSKAVHAAINRLKNPRHRETITRCWINGQDRDKAADEMGIKVKALYNYDLEARDKLRKDLVLKQYAMPHFSSSLAHFRHKWTSSVEASVIWRDEHRRDLEQWRTL